MVRVKARAALIMAPVAVLLVLLPAAASLAQELGEEDSYSLSEDYRIELNELGDASITDTISYDPDWFSANGNLFQENPNLLSRRFRADTNLGEIENFDVRISQSKATVTVSFDAPGLAYLLDDGWHLFGYEGYRVVDEGNDRMVLEASWVLNNEFTLFEEMPLEEKVTIFLPEGARNAEWDEKAGAVRYELPETVPAGGGFLYRHKALFTAIFSLLAALGLLLFLYASTRRPGEPVPSAAAPTPGAPAPPGAPPLPGMPPPAEPPAVTPPAEAHISPPPSPPAPENPPAPPSPREKSSSPAFCTRCGYPRGGEDVLYCRRCGARYE